MLSILKRSKKEQLGFDLCRVENQRAVMKASSDHGVPLIYKGNGVFVVDTKYTKADDRLSKFLRQFMDESINCKQGIVDQGDPKYDYILIYDLEEE